MFILRYEKGRVAFSGATSDFMAQPQIRQQYLGV